MSKFWRLRKQDYYNTAFVLKNRISELKNVDADYISDCLRGSDLEFYKKELIKTPILIRLTLPFALIIMLILLIGLPVNYIICGKWGYKWKWLSNWLRMLGIL